MEKKLGARLRVPFGEAPGIEGAYFMAEPWTRAFFYKHPSGSPCVLKPWKYCVDDQLRCTVWQTALGGTYSLTERIEIVCLGSFSGRSSFWPRLIFDLKIWYSLIGK